MKNEGKPKYLIVMEELKEEIRSGRIAPGDKIPSENMLTKKYQMSRHTIRKALAILVQEEFVVAKQGQGTFCADTERTRRNTKIIAVVTTYISNYIFPQLISGIEEVLTEQGYSIVLKNTKNSRAIEIRSLEEVLKQNVDGIIIEPSKSEIYSRYLEIFKRFEAFNIPTVFLHSTYPQFKDKPSVELDDELGMYQITKYLLELGHRELVGIFKTDDSQGLRRHCGYVRALNEYGILYNPEKIIWYHTEDKRLKPKAEILEMLQNNIPIDAIVCYNDQLAQYVMESLIEEGIRVPEDISITGFDNTLAMNENGIAITTMNHPKEEVGREAARMMLRLIDSGENRENEVIKVKISPELVIKNSCVAKQRLLNSI